MCLLAQCTGPLGTATGISDGFCKNAKKLIHGRWSVAPAECGVTDLLCCCWRISICCLQGAACDARLEKELSKMGAWPRPRISFQQLIEPHCFALRRTQSYKYMRALQMDDGKMASPTQGDVGKPECELDRDGGLESSVSSVSPCSDPQKSPSGQRREFPPQ